MEKENKEKGRKGKVDGEKKNMRTIDSRKGEVGGRE